MNEDIDEILANILAKEPLTDEEKQHLQIWSNISSKNEKTKKFIQALEQQKKVLDKHQKQETVFTRIKKQVYQKKKKRHIICLSVRISLLLSAITTVAFSRLRRRFFPSGKINSADGWLRDKPATYIWLGENSSLWNILC